MDDREKFAKVFKVNLPEELFKGKMSKLPRGLNSRAKEYFSDYEDVIKNSSSDLEKWGNIRLFFLSIPSLYGSQKEEGVVFHLSKEIGGTPILKIVQDDQYDKELRGSQKAKFKMDWEDEDNYWINIRAKAKEIVGLVDYTQPLYRSLKEVSKIVYKDWKVDISHNKKSEQNIRDDVQLTVKSMLVRLMPGNNGALLIGKFRVVTNGHMKMFKQAMKNSDQLVVAVVSNKETKKTLQLRIDMVKAAVPEAEIITTTSGNLLTILNKTSTNINKIYAGSDRIDSYKNQLKRNLDVGVEEILRTDNDESATKVIRNLSDIKYFKKNTPKSTHKFLKELTSTYGVQENFRTQGNQMKLYKLKEDAGNGVVQRLEQSIDELTKAQRMTSKLPEGKRLSKNIGELISQIEEEIMFVQKGEYN
jgi:cytidyltransferase-like protein